MKIKMLLVAALLGVASLSAHAGVAVSVGLPLPVPAIVAPPVVVGFGPGYVCGPRFYGPRWGYGHFYGRPGYGRFHR